MLGLYGLTRRDLNIKGELNEKFNYEDPTIDKNFNTMQYRGKSGDWNLIQFNADSKASQSVTKYVDEYRPYGPFTENKSMEAVLKSSISKYSSGEELQLQIVGNGISYLFGVQGTTLSVNKWDPQKQQTSILKSASKQTTGDNYYKIEHDINSKVIEFKQSLNGTSWNVFFLHYS